MSDSESLPSTARPVPRGRIRRGAFPGSTQPSWIHLSRSFHSVTEPSGSPTKVQLPGGVHGFSPSGHPPPVRHGRKRSLCPVAPCGALQPGSPFPSALPAAPGRIGDATGATTTAPPCPDNSSARSAGVPRTASRCRRRVFQALIGAPDCWTPSGPGVDRSCPSMARQGHRQDPYKTREGPERPVGPH
jgi:hypothetical protein